MKWVRLVHSQYLLNIKHTSSATYKALILVILDIIYNISNSNFASVDSL